jgi:hypothetical protein
MCDPDAGHLWWEFIEIIRFLEWNLEFWNFSGKNPCGKNMIYRTCALDDPRNSNKTNPDALNFFLSAKPKGEYCVQPLVLETAKQDNNDDDVEDDGEEEYEYWYF